MDWARAKNIMLAVLILLNLFLFFNVLNIKEPFSIIGQYQKDAKQVLQNAGVIITGRIPSIKPVGRISYIENDLKAHREMIQRLAGHSAENMTDVKNTLWEADQKSLQFFDESFVYTDNTNEFEIPMNRKKLDQKLKAWIRDQGMTKDTFVQDVFLQENNTTTVVYVRKYKNMPLFSQKIQFTIVNDKLHRVEGSLKIFEEIKLNNATDDIISVSIVLLTGKDKVQGTVKSIDLGYLCLENDDLYDTPVWRVMLETGRTVWFNAYTGEWLQ